MRQNRVHVDLSENEHRARCWDSGRFGQGCKLQQGSGKFSPAGSANIRALYHSGYDLSEAESLEMFDSPCSHGS